MLGSVVNFGLTVLAFALALCAFFYRARLASLDPSLYQRTIWGTGLVALGRVLNSVSLFGQVEPKSASILQAVIVVEFLGYSLGATLMIGAVSKLWSHLQHPGRLENKDYLWSLFHRNIPSLLPADKDPNQTIGAFLAYLHASFGYDAISIHLLDNRQRTLKLWRCLGMEKSWWSHYDRLPVKGSLVGAALERGKVIFSEQVKSDPQLRGLLTPFGDLASFLSCPIRFGERALGVFSVYSRERRPFRRVEIRTLVAAVEQLSTILTFSEYRERLSEQEPATGLLPGLEKVALSSSEVGGGLCRVASLLRKLIPCDQLSLLLSDRSGRKVCRYTASAKGGDLVESKVNHGELGSMLKALIADRKGQIINHLHSPTEELHCLPFASNCGSMMLVPFDLEASPACTGGASRGILVCASETPEAFEKASLKLLEAASVYMAIIAQKYLLAERLEQEAAQAKELTRKLASSFALADSKERFGEVAEALVNGLPTTTCRVMLFHSEASSLRPLGSFDRRRMRPETTSSTDSLLNESPLLRKLRVSQQPFTVDTLSPSSHLSEEEHLTIFGGEVKSGLLVPVTSGEDLCGVIALGERRNPLRRPFTGEEVEFCRVVADRLAPVLSKPPKGQRLETRLSELAMESLPDLVFEMRSPLTAILGNCELLLKAPACSLAQETKRRLETIQRSARRLHLSLEKLANLHSSLLPPREDKTYQLGDSTADPG